jgi:hypothetical protein
MKRPYETVRVDSILGMVGTGPGGVSTGGADPLFIGQNVNVSILCGADLGSTVGLGETATVAKYIHYSVYESTGASAGSAISGATLMLGAATAYKARGVACGWILVTSNAGFTTAKTVSINGISYNLLDSGPTLVDGSVVAAQLASCINGAKGTFKKLPHYTAMANIPSSGYVYLTPDDDQATGLTIIASAVSTYTILMKKLQGFIDIDPSKFSTCSPKYITVQTSTFSGTTSAIYALAIRKPFYSPNPGGKVVSI